MLFEPTKYVMSTKWILLMALKAILVFGAFSTVNACSKDNPCLYYGICVTSRNTSSCQCQPGFTGAFCENKIRGLVVCGTYTKRIVTSGNKSSLMEIPLRLATCPKDTKCFSVRYKGNDTVDVSERRCINALYCSQGCTHVKKAVRGTNITSCNSSCCDGDFCNAMELFVNRTLVVSPCESSPCLNGGTCKYANRNYTCACQASYSGSYCERYISTYSACQSNPCGINATCIENNGQFSCVYSVNPERSCETGLKFSVFIYVVAALTVVIIASILCIMLLIHRLRKKNRMMPREDIVHKDGHTNPSDIPSHATSEISMSTMIQEPANNEQPDLSSYMDLKPTQDKNTTYQSLDVYANENIPARGTDASTQGLTPSGEYMDLKPRQDVHYEKLSPKETTPAQSYEQMS